MFYKIVPYKWVLYSYSNLLIAKANQIRLRSIPKLFTVDSLDKLKYIVNIYSKVVDLNRKFKVGDTIFTPVLNNWYISYNKKNEGPVIIPNAILLLLERPSPSNPYDFDLFKNDSKLWYKKLQQIKVRDLMSVFVYDPLHIPDILIYYIPLILINKHNEGGIHTTSCYTDVECQAYAEVDEFYILVGIWVPDRRVDYVEKHIHISVGNLVKLCNPFFCSNPFEYNHRIPSMVKNLQMFHHVTSKSIHGFNIVIEFLTSSIAIIGSIIRSYAYIWLPIPSIKLLSTIHRFFSNTKADNLLIVDILGNLSEIGSTHTDRIWIGILRRLTKAKNVKAIIGGIVS